MRKVTPRHVLLSCHVTRQMQRSASEKKSQRIRANIKCQKCQTRVRTRRQQLTCAITRPRNKETNPQRTVPKMASLRGQTKHANDTCHLCFIVLLVTPPCKYLLARPRVESTSECTILFTMTTTTTTTTATATGRATRCIAQQLCEHQLRDVRCHAPQWQIVTRGRAVDPIPTRLYVRLDHVPRY